MSKQTKSEKIFEEILGRKKIVFNRIAEDANKTPDYEIILDDMRTYWEIKELSENEDQKKLRKQIDQGEVLAIDIQSDGLEDKIKKAKQQFKGYKVENQPCIIVIADCREFFFKDFNILISLKGLIIGNAHYAENEDGYLTEIYRELGLLTNRGKYISAIAFLNEKQQDLIFLHNPNTIYPLLNGPLTSLFKHHEFVQKTKQGLTWVKYL